MNIIKTKEIKEKEKKIYIIMEYCKPGELYIHNNKKEKIIRKRIKFFLLSINKWIRIYSFKWNNS